MTTLRLAAWLALAACSGSETTSFRTTDRGDNADRAGPPAAAYELRVASGALANVHVWSNGGYIGSSDEPMTHVGFQIDNRGARPIVFDSDALRLVTFDRDGAALPAVAFVAVTPLGPARVPVAAGASATLDAYFKLPVRPRAVDSMRVQWTLRAGDASHSEITTFVRDDLYPVLPPPRPAEPIGTTRVSS